VGRDNLKLLSFYKGFLADTDWKKDSRSLCKLFESFFMGSLFIVLENN